MKSYDLRQGEELIVQREMTQNHMASGADGKFHSLITSILIHPFLCCKVEMLLLQ